jgi:hypothetical protein
VFEREHLHPPQEPDRLAWKWIVAVAAATVFVSGALSYCARCIVVDAQAQRVDEPLPLPDGALEYELFEGEEGEGQREREAGRQRLRSWGWRDRETGIVHMPIERAMEVVVEREGRP